MQFILTAVATGASVLGIVYAFLAQRVAVRDTPPVPERRLAIYAGAGAVLLFLFTLPTGRPFSPGLTLGWGFLIGSALGIAAMVLFAGEAREEAAGTVGLLATAALVPSMILLVVPGYPTEALIGGALGAALPAVLCAGAARPLAALEGHDPGAACRGMEVFALAATVGTAGAWLGLEHFPRLGAESIAGAYWSIPGLAIAVGALVLALFSGSAPRGLLVPGLLAGIVVIIAVGVLQWRLLPELSWLVPLFGVAAFAVIAMVLVPDEGRPVALTAGASLLALALTALAFRTLQGYGQALALAAALPLVATARRENAVRMAAGRPLLLGAFTVAVALMLYRVFLEGAGRGFDLDFQQTYNLLALIVGAGAAFAGLTYAEGALEATGRGDAGLRPLLLRTAGIGLLVSLAPLVFAATLGLRAEGAFLVGLVLAETVWMLLVAWSAGDSRRTALAAAPHVFVTSAFLCAVQFTPLVLSFTWTRTARVWVVGIAGAIALLWLVADTLARRRPESEARHEAAA